MEKSRAFKAFMNIAERDGVSVEEVKQGIQMAIDAAMENPDPQVRRQWEELNFHNKKPTPEEFVAAIMKQLEEK